MDESCGPFYNIFPTTRSVDLKPGIDRSLAPFVWIITPIPAIDALSKPMQEKYGMKVVEVANIQQALTYFTEAGQSID